MEGSGRLVDGRIILCSTEERVFEWDHENKVKALTAFKTVAKCQWSQLLSEGDSIYVDAPWFKEFLAAHGNQSGLLDVQDNGQAQGLCNSGGHEGIDLYMGTGEPAYSAWYNEFLQKDVNENEVYKRTWWPLYRVKK